MRTRVQVMQLQLRALERRIREVSTVETDRRLLRVRIEEELREEHHQLLVELAKYTAHEHERLTRYRRRVA